MNLNNTILSKILPNKIVSGYAIAATAILIMAWLALPVMATSPTGGVVSNLVTEISLQEGRDVLVKLQISITNPTDKYLDKLEASLPYAKLHVQESKLNGTPVSHTIRPSNNGSTPITISFGSNVIAPNQSGVVSLSLFVTDFLATAGEYKYLSLSTLLPDTQVSKQEYKLNLTNQLLDSLIYVSHADYNISGNTLRLTKPQDTYILWGPSSYSGDIDISHLNETESTTVINLPAQIVSQQVEYVAIAGAQSVGRQTSTQNIWAFVNPNSVFRALAQVSIQENPANPPGIDKCAEYQAIPADYIDQLLSGQAVSRDMLLQLDELDTSSLDLACAIQAAFVTRGTKAAVAYGYYMADVLVGSNAKRLDVRLPRAWVVFEQNSDNGESAQVRLIDPEWQIESGHANPYLPNQLRLVMGYYDSAMTHDTALGLANNQPVLRPELVGNLNISSFEPTSLEVVFPKALFSGEFYGGTVIVTNSSARLLDLRSLSIDRMDLSKQALALYPGIVRMIQPGINVIQVDSLREPNFLRDSQIQHTFAMQLYDSQESISPLQDLLAVYTVNYAPDPVLIGVVAGTGAVIMAGIVVQLFRLGWRRSRAFKAASSKQTIRKVRELARNQPGDDAIKVEDLF